jgi:hypothetical protein
MREWGIPLHEVADMAAHLPPDSAVRRHLDEHWQRSGEIDLLRDIEHDLRVATWVLLKQGGQKNVQYPDPIGLPWDPPAEGTVQGDRMTFEEADAFLGWDKLKAAGRQT